MRTAICATILVTAGNLAAAEPAWLRDYAVARAKAMETGKLLFISVHTTWCGPCQAMQRTTFRDPRVVRRLGELCVCLSLDGDADARLVRQMGVKAYPTELLSSADGRILESIEGYADAARLLAALDRAQKAVALEAQSRAAPSTPNVVDAMPIAAKSKAVEPKPKPEPQAPASENLPIAVARPQPRFAPDVSAAKPRFNGFCPVTMLERAELVRGSALHAATHLGQTYWCRSPRELALFQKEPAKYLPAESGRCVVTWLEAQQWQQGKIEYPALFGDKLYLFGDSAHRDKFLRDPERYVGRAGNLVR